MLVMCHGWNPQQELGQKVPYFNAISTVSLIRKFFKTQVGYAVKDS